MDSLPLEKKKKVVASEYVKIIIKYRRLWLISACAYSGKRNDSMRLIKDMRLYCT